MSVHRKKHPVAGAMYFYGKSGGFDVKVGKISHRFPPRKMEESGGKAMDEIKHNMVMVNKKSLQDIVEKEQKDEKIQEKLMQYAQFELKKFS